MPDGFPNTPGTQRADALFDSIFGKGGGQEPTPYVAPSPQPSVLAASHLGESTASALAPQAAQAPAQPLPAPQRAPGEVNWNDVEGNMTTDVPGAWQGDLLQSVKNIPAAAVNTATTPILGTGAAIHGMGEAEVRRNQLLAQKALKSQDPALRDQILFGRDLSDSELSAEGVSQEALQASTTMSDKQKWDMLRDYIAGRKGTADWFQSNKKAAAGQQQDLIQGAANLTGADLKSPEGKALQYGSSIVGGVGTIAMLAAVGGPAAPIEYMVEDSRSATFTAATEAGQPLEVASTLANANGLITALTLGLANKLPRPAQATLTRDLGHILGRSMLLATVSGTSKTAALQLITGQNTWKQLPEEVTKEALSWASYELAMQLPQVMGDITKREFIKGYQSESGTGAKGLVADIDRAIDQHMKVLVDPNATPAEKSYHADQIKLLEHGMPSLDEAAPMVKQWDRVRELADAMAGKGQGTDQPVAKGTKTTKPVAQPTLGTSEQPAPTEAATPKVTSPSKAKGSPAPESVVPEIPIKNPAVEKVTDAFGQQNHPDSITEHTPDTARIMSNRMLGNTLNAISFGGARAAGHDVEDKATKNSLNSIANAINMPNGVQKIAGAWSQIGGMELPIEALNKTVEDLKAQGIDMNRSTLGPDAKSVVGHEVAIPRATAFMETFNQNLGDLVKRDQQNALHDGKTQPPPDWLTNAVYNNGQMLAPGSKYDNALRKGQGLEPRTLVPESVSAPVATPIPATKEPSNVPAQATQAAQPAEAGQPSTGVSEAGPKPSEAKPGGVEGVAEPRSVAERVERAHDAEQLKRLEEAPQVQGVSPSIQDVGGHPMVHSVQGRFINITSPRAPRNPEASGTERLQESQEWTKKPMIAGMVDADGNILVGMVQNGGETGLGKHLYRALAEQAVQHFGIDPKTSLMIGESSPEAVKSRMSYPGTEAEQSTIDPKKQATATPVQSILDYKIKEAPNAEAREATGRPEGAVEQTNERGAERAGVASSPAENDEVGNRPDEAGRDAGSVLPADQGGTSEGSDLPDDVAKLVSKASVGLKNLFDGMSEEELPLHAQVMESTNWGDYDPFSDENGAFGAGNKVVSQVSGAVFPVPKGSPFKRPFNLTPSVFYKTELLEAMGLKIPPALSGDFGFAFVPGHILLSEMVDQFGASGVRSILAKNGFDSIAAYGSGGLTLIPTGDTASATPADANTAIEKTTGTSLRQKSGNPIKLDYEPTKPGTPDEIVEQPPIADIAERTKAVDDAKDLLRYNHVTAEDMLKLAKEVGAPIGKLLTSTEWTQVMRQVDAEHGLSVSDQTPMPVTGGPNYADKYTPSELAAKFVDYAHAGGIPNIIYWLQRNGDFHDALEKGTQIGREKMRPLSDALLKLGSIAKDRRAEFIADMHSRSELGSNTRYRLARELLKNSLERWADPNDKDTPYKLSDAITNGELSPPKADMVSLIIQAAMQYRPDLLSVTPEYHAEQQQRERESGTYDEKNYDANGNLTVTARKNKILPALSAHHDVRPEKVESFAPSNDVYQDKVGQYRERLGAGFDPEREAAAPAGSAGKALSKVFQSIAERGGFTPDRLEAAGVPVRPKATHIEDHDALVNKAETDPAFAADLKDAGWHVLADPGNLPVSLRNNGYATAMMKHLSGERNLPYTSWDSENPRRMTLGQQLVVQTNLHSSDGLPVADFIMGNREMSILLDENHPLYNATCEATLGKVASNADVISSGVPHTRVVIDGKGMLLPTQMLLSGDPRFAHIENIPGGRTEGKEVAGADHYYQRSAEEVAARVHDYVEAMSDERPGSALSALGNSLLDRFIMGKEILRRIDEKGDIAKELSTPKMRQKLVDSLAELKDQIEKVKQVGKNDIHWNKVFPGVTDTAATHPLIPTRVSQDAIRTKEQLMKMADDLGFTGDKHFREVLDKIDPRFFESGSVVIDPKVDLGACDELKRIIKFNGDLKTRGLSNVRMMELMAHELGHFMRAYRSHAMLEVTDRWFRSERNRVVESTPHVKDILNAVVPDPRTGEETTVGDIYEDYGSLAKIMMGVHQAEALMADHANAMIPMNRASYPISHFFKAAHDSDGNVVGYNLSRGFIGNDNYRVLNHSEFDAETFKDGLLAHAATMMSPGVREANAPKLNAIRRYIKRMDAQAPGTRMAQDSIHVAMGQLMDAAAGKNVVRRFVGYVLGMEAAKANRDDIATPDINWRNSPTLNQHGRLEGAPPQSPEDLAKADYAMMASMGRLVNKVRSGIMRKVNASTINDVSRAAAMAIRQMVGEFGRPYHTNVAQLAQVQKDVETALHIPFTTVRDLKAKAEASPVGQKAKADNLGNTMRLTGNDGKQYGVFVNSEGKFDRAVPMEIIQGITDYQKTGKYTGPMAGLETIQKPLNDLVWNANAEAVANLADAICVDPEHIVKFDERVKRLKNYYPEEYLPRKEIPWEEHLLGAKAAAKGGTVEDNPDTGVGVYGTHVDPMLDMGVNAGHFLDKKFETHMEAFNHGYMSKFDNPAESLTSGLIANGLGVAMRLKTLNKLLDMGMAVAGHDVDPRSSAWPTVRMATLGLKDDLFGGSLHDIRLHPDVVDLVRYMFSPDYMSRGSIGRRFAESTSMLNMFQLAGPFDLINGAIVSAGFAQAAHEEEAKQANTKRLVSKTIRNVALAASPVLGAAATHAMGIGGMPGAVAGPVLAATMLSFKNKFMPMTADIKNMMGEGQKVLSLVRSKGAVNPERLPQSAREIIKALELVNYHLPETPIQIERMKNLYGSLMRQAKYTDAVWHKFLSGMNMLPIFTDFGAGVLGGKMQAKLGAFSAYARVVMDQHRDLNGQVKWEDPAFVKQMNLLSTNLDSYVGVAGYKNLHQTPALIAFGKLMMRAYQYSFGSETAFVNAMCDFANNTARGMGKIPVVGKHILGGYEAFREAASGGASMRPPVKSGDTFSWRPGTLGYANVMLASIFVGRLMAMASHVIWPGSTYSMAEYARESYRQLHPIYGKVVAGAFRSLIAVAPPEGSAMAEAARHIYHELMAPQVGRNNPTTGHPKGIAPPGNMYVGPFEPENRPINPAHLLTPSKWLGDIGKYTQSHLNPVTGTIADIANDHDALGRPLGIGDPLRSLEQVKRFNQFFEAHPGDDMGTYAIRRMIRSAGHLATMPFSLTIRGAHEFGDGGNPAVPLGQAVGARSTPQGWVQTKAERIAYEARYANSGTFHQDQASMGRAEKLRIAREDMEEMGDHRRLDLMRDNGELDEDPGKNEWRYKNELKTYMNKSHTEGLPPLIRLMRGVMDPSKTIWKEIYQAGNTEEKAQVINYLEEKSHQKGATTVQKHTDSVLLEWMKVHKR